MDFICEYVKKDKCVDFEDPEIQDIIEAVDILMKRFAKRMQLEYPDMKIKELRLCGSMAEQTRLSNKTYMEAKMEFDYLAVLETWTACGKQRFEESEQHPGYMIIEHDVKDTSPAKSENTLLSNRVGEIFISHFVKCVESVCKRNFCQRKASTYNTGIDFFFGCNFCTVYMKSGNLIFKTVSSDDLINRKLAFVWIQKMSYDQAHMFLSRKHEKDNYAAIYNLIDVDFHPIFVKNTNYKNFNGSVDSNIALFPKGFSTHTHDVCRLFLWRKSTQEQETKMINKTSSAHKLAFMTLKHMFPSKRPVSKDTCQILQKESVVSQYMLKNIFLLHIRKCNKKQTAGGCLVNLIELMSRCCIEHKLPHFLLNYDLFENVDGRYRKDLFDNVEKRFITDVYRIEAFGYCLQAVSALSTTPNVHSELQDIAQDLFTISFIALASEAEASSSNYHQAMYLLNKAEDCDLSRSNKEVPKITKTVIKKFLHLRHDHSAMEAQNYFFEKYSFFRQSGNNFLNDFRMICRESAPECHPSICDP